jgi:high-affinity Fe2+/Pb2+ permease
MTDEQRQRQMDFIVNTLAGLTAKIDALTDTHTMSELERKADAVRTGRLEESMVTLARVSETLTQLAQKYGERLVEHDAQINEHDSQITDVKQAIVILTKLLNERRNGKA